MAKQKYILPLIALIIAYTIWGFNTVFIKIGLETIPPALSVGLRFTVSALCILPLALKTWRPLKNRYLLLFILASFLSISLSALTLHLGLRQVPAFNAGVIWLTSPILLVVLSASLLRERIRLRTLIGVAIAIAGSMIVISHSNAGVSGQSSLTGNLFIVLSVIFDVIAILMTKPLMKRVSSYQGAFLSILPGALPVLVYAVAQSGTWTISSVSRSSAMAFAISTVITIVANCLFFYALRYRQAHTVGVYSYLDPMFTVVGSWFILGERPGVSFVLGAGLIITGLFFTELKIAHSYMGHHHHHK